MEKPTTRQTKCILYSGKKINYVYIQPAENTMANSGTTSITPLTILLVHGFPETGKIFEQQIVALENHYNIIIPDLPGSGASDFNPGLHSTTDYAAALKAIIDEEKIDQLVLLGHSMGGYIALAFAEKYPGYVQGLGLLHSTAYADSEEKKANRVKAIKTMEKYGGPVFLRSMIPTLFGEDFTNNHPTFIQQLIQAGTQFETKTLQQYYQIMHDRTDKTPLLTKLPIPYLFITGEEDKAAPAADLIYQASLPDIAIIEVLPRAGHMGFIEKAPEVNQHIKHFLQLVQNLQH